MYSVGYVAGCYFLGRLILKEPKNRLLAFLVGWGILRVVNIVPVLGGLSRPPRSCTASVASPSPCSTPAAGAAYEPPTEPPTDFAPADPQPIEPAGS